MRELKINVPDGYEIDKDKSTFENVVFKKKENELPTYWTRENNRGYSQLMVTAINNLGVDVLYATKEQARASVALAKLSQLRDVYRQGWEPDWSDVKSKYCIIFNGNNAIVHLCSYYTKFLSFQDKETAKLFYHNFRDLIEQAKPLMS